MSISKSKPTIYLYVYVYTVWYKEPSFQALMDYLQTLEFASRHFSHYFWIYSHADFVSSQPS
jgi:hypothetical protein